MKPRGISHSQEKLRDHDPKVPDDNTSSFTAAMFNPFDPRAEL